MGSLGENESQSDSDLAVLWKEALDDYCERAKIDIRQVMQQRMSINSIMMDQQQQLHHFGSFRHNSGKVDKLRSVIARNADVIQSVAVHVSNAATGAFPPSSAILTAFTYVMNASKHVSDDYDAIEGFFDIMQSFLQRLSLLESKLPAQKAYQGFLMRVFASLLQISGIARAYCLKGRFLKWAKALIDGKDPELQGALNGLHENIQRLESATILQTLRTTIETHEEAKATNANVKTVMGQNKQIQTSIEQNTALTEQVYDVTEQTLTIAVETSTSMKEITLHSRETAGMSQEMLRRQDQLQKAVESLKKKNQERAKQSMQSGASKPANLERLKGELRNPAEGGMRDRLRDMELVNESMFGWLEKEEAFEELVEEETRCLSILGEAGMGKSTVAFKMFRLLKEKLEDDSTAVVCFFFDEEHPQLTDFVNMLTWTAIRTAEKGMRNYCEEVLTQTNRSANFFEPEDAWQHLIADRFAKGSNRRLVLVLDALDHLGDKGLAVLVKYMELAAKDELRVQFVIAGDPRIQTAINPIVTKTITLTREKIARDIHRLAKIRVRELPRLRKMRQAFRRKMVAKITQKADTFLYVEHSVRRFNALRREGLILKELDSLPDNTTQLYETLLDECKKNRTPNELEVLRNLFAWLAYAKEELTLGDANLLVSIIAKENSVSIEEELDGRSSRLLRISGTSGDNEDKNDSDSSEESEADALGEKTKGSGDNSTEDDGQDTDNLLGFQERSLRVYFRQAVNETVGLRCPPTEAQIIIFKMIAAILTGPAEARSWPLERYGSKFWITHFLAIDVDQATDAQVAQVLESLFSMLNNNNDALKSLEWFSDGDIFLPDPDQPETQAKVLAALQAWAKRALSLPPNSLPYGLMDWYRPLASAPTRVFITLARAHIRNWFSGVDNFWEAMGSFQAAHNALREGRDLPELRQNPTLRQYFEQQEKEKDEKSGDGITEKSFEVVANAFWDIVKTSASYRGIGMAMRSRDYFERAVEQLDLGLSLLDGLPEHRERFKTLDNKGEALLLLGKQTEEERPGDVDLEKNNKKFLTQAIATLEEAITLFDSLVAEENPEKKADKEVGESLLDSVTNVFENHALASALLGNFDACMVSLARASGHPTMSLGSGTMAQIAVPMAKAGRHELIMRMIKSVKDVDRMHHVAFNRDFDDVFHAAKATGEGEYVLDLFRTVARDISTRFRSVPFYRTRILIDAAAFARGVLGDDETAKTLLREIITDRAVNRFSVSEAVDRLTELQLESFLRSSEPLVKAASVAEARSLRAKLAEVLDSDFNPAESNTAVALAVMLRRLGPATEYADVLQAAFRNCVEELGDDTGANDMWSLRRLSRVLSVVDDPRFARDAQIAYTAMQYILDDDIHRRETESGDDGDDGDDEGKKEDGEGGGGQEAVTGGGEAGGTAEGTAAAEPPTLSGTADAELKTAAGIEVPTPDANGVNSEATKRPLTPVPQAEPPVVAGTPATPTVSAATVITDGPVTAEPAAAAATSEPENEMDEGLLTRENRIHCDICNKPVGVWSTQGGAYHCLYCIDKDICDPCMREKLARESGEMEADWRVVCPRGHRHIKAPVEGWRGVKGGRFRIGEEEIPVKTWLRDLQVKWEAHWREYWTEELDG